jgi:protein-tyrosine phosphatase
MIDIHSHILPGIDDGSTDLQQSLESLKKIAESGTRRLYLTSHFFKGHYEYSRAEYDRNLTSSRAR